ncbi:DUF1501 domain-containing protein [Alteromonadaceae bacterium M269]|nr:DUF1501 domain-containing protein [Alteromonadaceae bacterium M269]
MNSSRRKFLRHSLAGATIGTLSAALPNFQTQAAEVSGYKALVCVFLFGGMDNHDLLFPYDQPSYDNYSRIRASLLQAYEGIPGGSTRVRRRLLPLALNNAGRFGQRQFALPEEFSGIHGLFNSGNAAIVGNVGPLQQPLNRTQWEDESIPVPNRLFSHNDQQSTWMALSPEGASAGWGGRFADMAMASNANSFNAFTGVSTSGNSLFLTGRQTRPYPVTSEGGATFGALEQLQESRFDMRGERVYQALRQHLANTRFSSNHLIERDMAAASRQALNNNEAYNAALFSAPELSTVFPGNNILASQLQGVARSISLRNILGMRRQVFFVTLGGFDTHSAQADVLPGLQRQIDQAVTAFYQSTVEMGVASDVTLFTASDFGRTLTTNGDGTDHGWGGHQFVVGGGIRGRQIFGDVPVPELGHNLDAGNGRLIPSTSLQSFAAPLGRWFGLTEREVEQSLPGYENFRTDVPLFG